MKKKFEAQMEVLKTEELMELSGGETKTGALNDFLTGVMIAINEALKGKD